MSQILFIIFNPDPESSEGSSGSLFPNPKFDLIPAILAGIYVFLIQRLSGSKKLKLLQKAHIVFIKQLHIVNAVFQHGNALNAHAEGISGINFRIIVHKTVNGRVHHAGTQDLQPAGVGTGAAALAFADHATDIHLGARLGKGKKAGPEAQGRISAEHLVYKPGQSPLEVAEGDTFIY
jgi:hypothetical protein